MEDPELITATQEQLDEILARCRGALTPKDFHLLQGVLSTFVFLTLKLQNARTSIGRLKKLLFGPRTERLSDIAEDARIVDKPAQPADEVTPPVDSAASAPDAAGVGGGVVVAKRKGHGRNGADAYRGATVVECMHAELAGGQRCPKCGVGRIYDWVPRVLVRVTGQAPLAATIYRLERLRCRLCDAVFAAPTPAGVVDAPKYDASCASMLALMHYGSGMPFYRLEGLQASLQVPLPDATQWEIVRDAVPAPEKAYEELLRQAAQGRLLYNDDTPMRVLELMSERRAAEARGEDLFFGKANCAACHQATGKGVPPAFPPLDGSKIATGPVAAHLDTVMNGVVKNGQPTAMVAFKNVLSPTDLAAVVTYERNAWGNHVGDAVQPAQVVAAKK